MREKETRKGRQGREREGRRDGGRGEIKEGEIWRMNGERENRKRLRGAQKRIERE